ncbi:hypothetical protein ACHAXS_012402 [Conticribra weissflogii]
MTSATYELRVTVLSLDGIRIPLALAKSGSSVTNVETSSISQNTRITAWVGFRSSFHPESMTVPSSNYSSLFKNQGNLLAMESEQVDIFNISNESNYYSGAAYWINRVGNSQHMKQNHGLAGDANMPMPGNDFIPHLQIKLPPLEHDVSVQNPPKFSIEEFQPNTQRPSNIVEIHVCVTSTSLDPISCDDAEKENFPENTCLDGQNSGGKDAYNATFGVAHLKVPHTHSNIHSTHESTELGEVIQLPVTKCRTKSPNNSAVVYLEKNSKISLFVERVPTYHSTDHDENDGIHAKKHNINNQRHFVECGWPELNDRPNFAPPLIINQEEEICSRVSKNELLRSTPPRIIPIVSDLLVGRKSSKTAGDDEAKSSKPPPIITEENLEEISENAVNQSVVTGSDSFPFQLGPGTRVQTIQDKSVRDDNGDVAKSKKSLSQRIHEKVMCGTPLADFGEVLKTFAQAAQHCDEDHVDIYVQDSDSMGTSIATDNDIFGL